LIAVFGKVTVYQCRALTLSIWHDYIFNEMRGNEQYIIIRASDPEWKKNANCYFNVSFIDSAVIGLLSQGL